MFFPYLRHRRRLHERRNAIIEPLNHLVDAIQNLPQNLDDDIPNDQDIELPIQIQRINIKRKKYQDMIVDEAPKAKRFKMKK
ncbi:MAG: hypothetical protein CMF48_05715 [Legionellales bacterium]|nr:hypothetical protein [Legionellales bacterium]|tara:strand:+ start:501 stop:746 length:246 start_codon:yes stop_codon:yes gene_type:complete